MKPPLAVSMLTCIALLGAHPAPAIAEMKAADKEAFLRRFPVYRAPAGIDQEKWEQAGAEFPMIGQTAERIQRARQLMEKRR